MSKNLKITPPTQGSFLVSEPFLSDINFRRAVVLLCEHNDEGSLGFILNRQLDLKLDSAVELLDEINPPLYFGGPVETNTLHYLHRMGHLVEGSIEVTKGVYWGGSIEAINALIHEGKMQEGDLRFFLGYSGWSPDQLDEEIKGKSWYVVKADGPLVFEPDPEVLWKNILSQMGTQYAILANSPEHVSWN